MTARKPGELTDREIDAASISNGVCDEDTAFRAIATAAYAKATAEAYRRAAEICRAKSAESFAEQLRREAIENVDYAEIELEAGKKLGAADCAAAIEREAKC